MNVLKLQKKWRKPTAWISKTNVCHWTYDKHSVKMLWQQSSTLPENCVTVLKASDWFKYRVF